MAYLEQISAKPAPKNSQNFWQKMFSSVLFKILLGLTAFTLIFMIFASLISATRKDDQSETISLHLHIANVEASISTYQNSVKSSALRSYSSALSTLLSSADSTLVSRLTEKYAWKEKETSADLISAETALSDELNNDLFAAKINGKLDRVYAQKMAYETAYIANAEKELENLASPRDDSDYISTLEASITSLNNLYDYFNDFNEVDPTSLKELK